MLWTSCCCQITDNMSGVDSLSWSTVTHENNRLIHPCCQHVPISWLHGSKDVWWHIFLFTATEHLNDLAIKDLMQRLSPWKLRARQFQQHTTLACVKRCLEHQAMKNLGTGSALVLVVKVWIVSSFSCSKKRFVQPMFNCTICFHYMKENCSYR